MAVIVVETVVKVAEHCRGRVGVGPNGGKWFLEGLNGQRTEDAHRRVPPRGRRECGRDAEPSTVGAGFPLFVASRVSRAVPQSDASRARSAPRTFPGNQLCWGQEI